MVNPDDYLEELAARLDWYADVPDDVLLEIVTGDGAGMCVYADQDEPDWTGDELTDRELAARICANCSVRLACLELELRGAGPNTLGVSGALSEDDSRALYPLWLARRSQRKAGGGDTP